MIPDPPSPRRERKGRPLTVLLIDDRRPDSLMAADSFQRQNLDIQCIGRWADAQAWLQSGTAIKAADILLVDVGWLDDTGLDKIIKVKPESPVQPVGPLLALPFIGQRPIMACTVYSTHGHNAMLRRHPFFLLAMGLIAARTAGVPANGYRSKHLTKLPRGQVGELDKYIAELFRHGGGSAPTALAHALPEYRDQLGIAIEQGTVSLANREEVREQLARVVEAYERGEPLKADDSLYLGVVGVGWRDDLSLRSLFADELEWGGDFLTAAWAHKVSAWLEGGPDDAVARALAVIQAQDSAVAEGDPEVAPSRPLASEVVEQLYGRRLSKYDLAEVLRYVILFANVYVNETRTTFAKAAVFERLGDASKVSHNVYRNWFGLRNPGAKLRGPFGALRLLCRAEGSDPSIFVEDASVISALDYEAIQKYRAEEGIPADAARYQVAADGWTPSVHASVQR